jgi:hypothetical protein
MEATTMSETIGELASNSGLSIEQAKKGLGALLSSMKGHLPPESFSRLKEVVPDADQMMAGAEQSGPEPSGGILGAISSGFGKLFGGGEAAATAKLTQMGFSADQLQRFLPNALEFLKSKLPPDVMNRISSLIPGAEATAHSEK